MRLCSVGDCSGKHEAKGYCVKHYQQWEKYGDDFEGLAKTHERHGKRRTPEYAIWLSMKDRCNNPKNKGYVNYGGRGITVCPRWNTAFMNFYEDMGERPGTDYSIERIDNDGNYEPNNCKWATRIEQMNNRRNNILVTIGGEIKTLKQWSDYYGLDYQQVKHKYYSGTPVPQLFKKGKVII